VRKNNLKKGSPKQGSGYKGLNAQWGTKSMAWKERCNCRECPKRKHRDWAVNLHLKEMLMPQHRLWIGIKKPVRMLWAAGQASEKTHST